VAPPGVFSPLVGGNLHFAFALLQPASLASNPVRVDIGR
jgi:hypothetical protein